MRRALVALAMTLVVALALETGVAAAATVGGGPLAEQSAKKPGKKGKKKACKAKKKKGKAKRAGVDAAAKKKKGKKKASCKKRKPAKRTSPRDRGRERPGDRIRERMRERREQMEDRRRPSAPAAPVVPADGAYVDPATGVRVTISGKGTKALVEHTIAPEAFDCPGATAAPVSIDSGISKSTSNPGAGYLMGDQQIPGGVASVQGFLKPDGSGSLSLSASQPFSQDPNATCMARIQVVGPLVKQ